jgi:hypothetical protein
MAQLSWSLQAFFFTSVALVRAQEPTGELGPWPSGSLTLLVGMWLAVTCLSQSRLDVLPPTMLACILHEVPIIRRFFTLDRSESILDCILRRKFPWLHNPHPVSLIKQLVFTGINHAGRPVAQEWDALVLLSGGVQYEMSDQAVTLHLPDQIGGCIEAANDSEKKLHLQVTTGLDMRKFSKCVDRLLKELVPPIEPDPLSSSFPNDRLLFLWAGLRAYQRHPNQLRSAADEHNNLLRRGVNYYRPVLDPDDIPPNYPEGEATNTNMTATIPLYISGSQCAEKEMLLDAGNPRLLRLSARHLSFMLGFVEIVCGDWRRPINPLIFYIWTWMQGQETLSDSMVIQFPPSIRFEYPQAAGAEPNTHSGSAYVLDLSEEYHIDVQGGGYYLSLGIWFLNVFSSFLVAFFAIVSGAKPNLATTLGLLFAQPYMLSSSSFRDIGGLPSWNGRKQVRWGKGFKCGLFGGKYHRRQGPSGNSRFRASILYAASWIIWGFRSRLRTTLHFGQPCPAPTWVQAAAYYLEIIAMCIWLTGFFATFLSRVHLIQVIAFIVPFFYLVSVVILVPDTAVPPSAFFWYSELGILCTVPWVAIIHCGPGPTCASVCAYNATIWIHIIASSYF